jgi:hypothetical protein
VNTALRLLGIAAGTALLAGCGLLTTTPPTPSHHHRSHPVVQPHQKPTPHPHAKHAGGSPKGHSGGESPSQGGSQGQKGGSGRPPSGKNGQKGPGGGNVNPPPPPNVGNYQDLIATVLSVTSLGTADDSGKALPLYQLKIEVYNPTPAIIPLALNDLTVVPVGGADQYSWNDYQSTGLTAQTSLFWPISHPTDPTQVSIIVNAGSRVTGLLNVEVPAASHYDLVWGAPHSGDVAGTFTP